MDSPVGPIAIVKDLLRTTLAACTAFRTWDGHDWTVEEAKARIYFDALPPPAGQEYTASELNDLRPCAIISKDERGIRFEAESTAALGQSFRASGRLVVGLYRSFPDVSGETDPIAAADRQFENMVGQLMTTGDPNAPGLLELSGQAGYLTIKDLSEEGSFRAAPKDVQQMGDFQAHFLYVEWGRSA